MFANCKRTFSASLGTTYKNTNHFKQNFKIGRVLKS